MFHKSKTEAERQRLFDDYLLSILKEREVIKKNQKSLKKKVSVTTLPSTRIKSKVHSIVMWIVLSSRIF